MLGAWRRFPSTGAGLRALGFPFSTEMQMGSQRPCPCPSTSSACPLWCLSNLPAGVGGARVQVRLPWPPGVRDRPGRKEGHSLVRRSLWLATRVPHCAARPTAAMKACLTLLSLLGRLHEPPVPKPRGTPKLSERYGPREAFGPWWWEWGAPGTCWGGTGPTLYPPKNGQVRLWVGRECCAHIPSPEAPRGPCPVGSGARWRHPPLRSPRLPSPVLPS